MFKRISFLITAVVLSLFTTIALACVIELPPDSFAVKSLFGLLDYIKIP